MSTWADARRFSQALARELKDFDAVNEDAAGTFGIRKPISRALLLAEFRRRLLFEAECMICPSGAVLDQASGQAILDDPSDENVTR